MSFNINFNKPAITKTQTTQDGGAGNLGYMQGGKKSKKQEQTNSIFEEQQDSFTKEGKEEKVSFFSSLDRIIFTIKLIVQKIFKRN